MKERIQLTRNQKLFGVMLHSQSAFMRHFWADEISLRPSTRQKLLWNDVSTRVIGETARKVSKTLMLEGRIVRKSLAYRKRTRLSERMFAAPGDQQLQPTLLRLGTKIHANPLFTLLFEMNKNNKTITCRTNVVWHTRIDGTSADDRNMVGLRLDEIIFDEAAYTIGVCHHSRQQSALPNCEWLYTGVPNNVRNTPFWKISQTRAGHYWSHARASSYTNPLFWNETERVRLKADYADSPHDYITQVLGLWGEQMYSTFPPGSFAVDETIKGRVVNILPQDIPDSFEATPAELVKLYAKLTLGIPTNAREFALGMDYGYHQDPTEIGIAYRSDLDRAWRLFVRVHVVGVDPLAQARLIHYIVDLLGRERARRMVIDLMSGGVAVALELTQNQRWGEYYKGFISDFAVSTMVLVADPMDGNRTVKVRKKQWATEQLQLAMLGAKTMANGSEWLWIFKDDEMIQEMMDTRERKGEQGNVIYIPRVSHGKRAHDHCTDMLRCLVTAILEIAKSPDEQYSETVYLEEIGWADNPFRAEREESPVGSLYLPSWNGLDVRY